MNKLTDEDRKLVAEQYKDPLWVASIHLTNQVIGERGFDAVVAAALREYADSLDAPRAVGNIEQFVSTNGTKITASLGFCDEEPVILQSGRPSQPAQS